MTLRSLQAQHEPSTVRIRGGMLRWRHEDGRNVRERRRRKGVKVEVEV